MRHARIFIALALAGAFVLAACNDSADPAAEPSGETAQTSPASESPAAEEPETDEPEAEEPASGSVTYTAVDYGFDGPSELAAGDIEITLENAGTEPHELVFFPVAPGTTVEDAMAYLETNPDPQDIPDFVIGEPAGTFAKPGKVSRRVIETTVEPSPT